MLMAGGAAERAIVPALVAAAMSAATFVMLGEIPSTAVVLAALAGTFIVYVLDRTLWTGPEDAIFGNRWTRVETISVCAAAFALGATIPALRVGTVIVGGVIGIFALGYAVPVGGRRMKSLGAVKPMLVVTGWVLGSVLVPAAEAGSGSAGELVMLAVYRFFYFLPCVLMADLADADVDRRAGIETPSNRLPGTFVVRISELALGAAALLALVAFFGGIGGFILLDAAGLLVAWSVLRSIADAGKRSFYLDVAMTWPAVTALTWLAFA